MIKKEPPTVEQLQEMVTKLGGLTTAYDLCKEFVYRDYERQAVQLAMQRAMDSGKLVVHKDWKLSNG